MYIGTGQDSSRERRQEKKDHEPIAVRQYTYVLAIIIYIFIHICTGRQHYDCIFISHCMRKYVHSTLATILYIL